MLLSFKPRTHLSALHPKFAQEPVNFTPPFRDGDKNFVRLPKIPVFEATIVRQLSHTRYLVSVEGVLKHVHVNQMSHSLSI